MLLMFQFQYNFMTDSGGLPLKNQIGIVGDPTNLLVRERNIT